MSGPLLVLLCWAVLAFVLTGCGALVLSRIGRPASALEAFWVGVAALLAWGCLWHLFRPLDSWFWLVPVGTAGLGWWRGRLLRSDRAVALAVGVFAVWVAGHALTPLSSPDAGLYHVQVTRWYAEAAVVPGLGNLNPYASFNHAFFVLPASFGLGPFADRGWHLVNGLLVVGAMVLPLGAVARLLRGQTRLTGQLVFALLLGARLIDAVVMMAFSGPTADVAALAMGTYVLGRAASRPESPAWVSGLLLACLLSLKLTTLGVVVAAALAEWRLPERWSLRQTAIGVTCGAALLVPWLLHGVVLNGYLLFPVGWLQLPVDWAVPREIAESLRTWAWAFARWPGHTAEEVHASGWALRWLEVESLHNRDFLLPATTSALSVIALAASAWWRRPARQAVALSAAMAAGLVVWWLTLPDLRFAGALWWALAGALLGALVELMDRRRYVIGLTVAALVLGGFMGAEPFARWEREVPPLPQTRCTPTTLATGEPVCEAQWNQACFEKNCARTAPNTIEARVPGDLRGGFRPVSAGAPP